MDNHHITTDSPRELLAIVEEASAKFGVKAETICRTATGNGYLYERLKNRSKATVKDAQRIIEHIETLQTSPSDEAS